jgi:hypothetical protein
MFAFAAPGGLSATRKAIHPDVSSPYAETGAKRRIGEVPRPSERDALLARMCIIASEWIGDPYTIPAADRFRPLRHSARAVDTTNVASARNAFLSTRNLTARTGTQLAGAVSAPSNAMRYPLRYRIAR